MNTKSKTAQHDPWETGELGRSMDHVAVVDEATAKSVDNAMGLHPVSIRLEKELIAQLKLIAKCHGVAYQPMIRDLLNRFAAAELKAIVADMEANAAKRMEREGSDKGPVAEYFERERRSA
ncbi:hypothetical protein [Oleiagrimonas soli]|uniref:Putative DNA binding CopG/RHH family protein n=1 Tax=Oleiagrimonas soli TaxID=1543381 RepID=A0A099CWG6_9GAMM|nr:hypothetical protein [Oleiagrimonas soli]KGI78333.1 hypothetical protein LF63_0108475 [Oleiagrimonas soli]MBB6183170.1 putative DNA binding CopG/RHH family protein [Oleiagrimonas soli]